MVRFNLAIGGLMLAVGTASPALASTLYGTASFPFDANLYVMDQTNGDATEVGPIGTDRVGDLTSDTRAGSETLWGVRIGQDANTLDELLTIDPVTGAAIDSVDILFPVGAAHPGHMTSIAFDPVTGVLFGNTSVSFGAPFEALYTIDPGTGVATFVGRILFDDVFALGFDQSGNLFGVADLTNELISISTLTGNGALISALRISLAFDIASRPEDDVMFLVDSDTDSLYTLDTGDGGLTLVGDYDSSLNVVGLAFLVPEPGALALLVLGAAFLRARRGRAG